MKIYKCDKCGEEFKTGLKENSYRATKTLTIETVQKEPFIGTPKVKECEFKIKVTGSNMTDICEDCLIKLGIIV
jgi:DNA-directed RNA polymerase subunit RPC12/RpoP